MNVDWPKTGNYVVAVSGGIDSMALLHMLQARPGLKLTVAHFDHGIRDDSQEDRQLVQAAAENYGLPFAYHEGRLGAAAGEANARQARYRFLRQIQQDSGAAAIITAHHRDDLIETAILNMLRGTGRKGFTALSSREGMIRPLLKTTKKELIDYAKLHNLHWREDPTNQDIKYLRNYIRHRLLPKFSDADTVKLLTIVSKLAVLNRQLDDMLVNQLHQQSKAGQIDKYWFNNLPHQVAREVLAAWLRAYKVSFDTRTLERLVVAAKTASPGKMFPIIKEVNMNVTTRRLALVHKER
jgi:tRNA(Ile)-lysidine synthetase-like protein